VLPIASPVVRDGWVDVHDGRILAVGGAPADDGHVDVHRARRLDGRDEPERDLGSVALMPGLVNAHTHLELSHLRGAIPPTTEFVTWIRSLMAARREQPDPNAAPIVENVRRAIDESVAAGTILVGDISNTLVSVPAVASSALCAVVFYELLGFNLPDADRVVGEAVVRLSALRSSPTLRLALAAHAPYSVAPSVFRAMRRAMERGMSSSLCSVHLAESPAEVEFIATGLGPWRQLLEELRVWNPDWVPPGVSPVQYVDDLGGLHDGTLAVHGVQMSSADLARVASRRATIVACPRSNAYTGVGVPPIEAFYASGARVAVGTDSLASAPDLSVFSELAAMRAAAPGVPANRLLASATRHGAASLGWDADFGTLEAGRRARFLAVTVPAGVHDVEEYLVSGITPDEIAWVE
jgi:aminodeoxyfutalosine deaminase